MWLYKIASNLPAPFTLLDLASATAAKNEEATETEGIRISTVHGAKGTEADVVIMGGCEAEAWENGKDKDIEANRRLFYVGATRARFKLFLTWSKIRPAPGRAWLQEPRNRSKFITEIGL